MGDGEERRSETLLREARGYADTVDHLVQAAYSLVHLRLGQDHAATGLLYEASQKFSRRVLGTIQELEFALRNERNAL